MLNKGISSPDLYILGRGLLDFGLQKPPGPSTGAVACLLLVSSRLDCPGLSFAEVCAYCLEMSMWSFSGGMTLKCCSTNFFKKYK